MARAHRVAIISLISMALYLLVFLQFFSVPFVDDAVVQEIIPVLPWWLLVSFGSYSLWSLGWGLWTFRDCPEAYTELMAEISQAKNELRVKGVTVD
ncbi:dolichol-phosphate mannosyltransferase subunit 3 [Armillaria luteobubalina]|uniref:Dolichol-phosphate mannosyltransferase subunit 3 n=1 Tax=Armillaria luteobubalina TaxID=153913 RepID=A0AA39Q6I9_9AGAR|nr:dolichol-phosphate mannosyltransferase subunit 3 [Armillaria luteobubalina]